MKRSIYNPFKFEISKFNKPKMYKLEIPESELLELSKVSELLKEYKFKSESESESESKSESKSESESES